MSERIAAIERVVGMGHLQPAQRMLLIWALLRADGRGRVRVNKSVLARELNLERRTLIRLFPYLFKRSYLCEISRDGRGQIVEIGSVLAHREAAE